MSTWSDHACGPQCTVPAEAEKFRTAVAERLAAASEARELQSYAMTVHDALHIVGSWDGTYTSDRLVERTEPWWARVVLAECLAAHLLPTRFAAFASRREVATPVAAADAANAVSLQIAAHCVAAAQLLIQDTRQYCASRSSLGGLLWDQQAVRFRLADVTARADGTRELAHCAARRLAEGHCDERTLCAAGYTATALLNEISALSLHLRGAAGQVNASAARQLLIDARTLTTGSGIRPRTRRAFATAGSARD